jgi:hypothetical protein
MPGGSKRLRVGSSGVKPKAANTLSTTSQDGMRRGIGRAIPLAVTEFPTPRLFVP